MPMQGGLSIERMCLLARVSRTGFYRFLKTLVPREEDTEVRSRVVLRVEDEFGNIRPFAADAISFELTGPATLIGDNPFGLIGGTGAVWVRAGQEAGSVILTAKHPLLGKQTVHLTLSTAIAEVY
jgi:Glycoside hydrolase family 2 C-terminal domain 5